MSSRTRVVPRKRKARPATPGSQRAIATDVFESGWSVVVVSRTKRPERRPKPYFGEWKLSNQVWDFLGRHANISAFRGESAQSMLERCIQNLGPVRTNYKSFSLVVFAAFVGPPPLRGGGEKTCRSRRLSPPIDTKFTRYSRIFMSTPFSQFALATISANTDTAWLLSTVEKGGPTSGQTVSADY